ncbi:MAG: magnesium transporter CorA family protein [Clostridia bacterium]|nr:magnesium transporter CorA family protein [Clostridia bacterium]
MIKVFEEINNRAVAHEGSEALERINERTWIHASAPSKEEIRTVASVTGFDESVLLSLLDEEESAHLDVDDEHTLIVLDVPVRENDVYVTYPFSIIYHDRYFLTICKKETNLLNRVFSKFKRIEPHKKARLSLQIIYAIASSYIDALKVLDGRRSALERELRSSMKNDVLLDLMDLNKSLVYFSTSLGANKSVINRVKRLAEFRRYEQDFDLIEDMEVENNQAIEMCSIYREILTGMMDTFSSIISNNLNNVMKVLAIITLIISIPTLIASLFGMNVILPFAGNEYGFYFVIGISILCSALAGGALVLATVKKEGKRNKRTRRKKK